MSHAYAQAARQRGAASSKNLVILAVVAVVALLALIFTVPSGPKIKATEGEEDPGVAERLQPIGNVSMVAAAAAAGGGNRSGEEVYKAVCSACHANGTLGSPKFSDAAAWGPRVATGFEALLNSALKGKNSMPPQGGGATADIEVARAVVYMANAGGAKFPEPKAPDAPAAGN